MEEFKKDFAEWFALKAELQEKSSPLFEERDVWWCSLGVNLGFEIDGKNKPYERPVLVFRKFNRDTFIGIPLTSVAKDDNSPYYMNYIINGKDGSLVLSQIKLMSAKRLNRRMATMSRTDFAEVKRRIIALLIK